MNRDNRVHPNRVKTSSPEDVISADERKERREKQQQEREDLEIYRERMFEQRYYEYQLPKLPKTDEMNAAKVTRGLNKEQRLNELRDAKEERKQREVAKRTDEYVGETVKENEKRTTSYTNATAMHEDGPNGTTASGLLARFPSWVTIPEQRRTLFGRGFLSSTHGEGEQQPVDHKVEEPKAPRCSIM